MDRWADYGISQVRYNDKQTHIIKTKVHEDKGDSFGGANEWTRSEVVNAIASGKTFVTILKGSDDQWRRGQDIHVITVNRAKYIRTDRNRTASDNLGNLPEF